MEAERSPKLGWWYPKLAMAAWRKCLVMDHCVFTRFFGFLIDASKF
jgi:hypothetical protein